jgi:hypothetical protein
MVDVLERRRAAPVAALNRVEAEDGRAKDDARLSHYTRCQEEHMMVLLLVLGPLEPG